MKLDGEDDEDKEGEPEDGQSSAKSDQEVAAEENQD